MKTNKWENQTRGVGEAGWLHSRFSFSFAGYFNPERMGFGKLRVLNDDIIEGGHGFDMHPHSDMEIITLVTKGRLEHKDSEGHGGILRPGDVQVMSAGSGITHSEYNHAPDEQLALFQLWIETKELGISPQYSQRSFTFPDNTLVVVASGMNDADALVIYQQARIVVGNFAADGGASHAVEKGNGVFVLVIEGTFTVAGVVLERRDALEISDIESFSLKTATGGSIMLIEVPF